MPSILISYNSNMPNEEINQTNGSNTEFYLLLIAIKLGFLSGAKIIKTLSTFTTYIKGVWKENTWKETSRQRLFQHKNSTKQKEIISTKSKNNKIPKLISSETCKRKVPRIENIHTSFTFTRSKIVKTKQYGEMKLDIRIRSSMGINIESLE